MHCAVSHISTTMAPPTPKAVFAKDFDFGHLVQMAEQRRTMSESRSLGREFSSSSNSNSNSGSGSGNVGGGSEGSAGACRYRSKASLQAVLGNTVVE